VFAAAERGGFYIINVTPYINYDSSNILQYTADFDRLSLTVYCKIFFYELKEIIVRLSLSKSAIISFNNDYLIEIIMCKQKEPAN